MRRFEIHESCNRYVYITVSTDTTFRIQFGFWLFMFLFVKVLKSSRQSDTVPH